MSRAHRIISLVEFYGGEYGGGGGYRGEYGGGGGGGYSSHFSPHHMAMTSAPHHSDSWGSNYDDPPKPKSTHTLAKVIGGGALALGAAALAHHYGYGMGTGSGGGSGLHSFAQNLPAVSKLPLVHSLPIHPPVRGAIELLKPPIPSFPPVR